MVVDLSDDDVFSVVVDVLVGWQLAPTLRSGSTQRAIARFLCAVSSAWTARPDIVVYTADLLSKLFGDIEVRGARRGSSVARPSPTTHARPSAQELLPSVFVANHAGGGVVHERYVRLTRAAVMGELNRAGFNSISLVTVTGGSAETP